MIETSETLAATVRAGGYQTSFVADVLVDGHRVLADAPLSKVELTWNGDAKVRGTGRCVFEYTSDLGESIVPEDLASWLTPYATVLNVSALIVAGDFAEKVLLGQFKVIRVSDPIDYRKPFNSSYISVGSSVGLQLADLFRVTDKERFPSPGGPPDLTSVWAEIARLTGLPLHRNVDDAVIPSSVAYRDNRLNAVYDLAAILGGLPYVDEFGRVAIDPHEWPEESEPFPSGADGVIISRLPADLTDDGIYNQVVVRSHQSSTDGLILATAELEDGPLRYGGTFGRVPFFVSSQYVTTIEDAQQYAAEQLALVSQEPAVQFDLQVLPDPRRQVGDVVPFVWDGYNYLGRIKEVRLGSIGPMRARVVSQNLGRVETDDETSNPFTKISISGHAGALAALPRSMPPAKPLAASSPA